jgi:hypothetical protein
MSASRQPHCALLRREANPPSARLVGRDLGTFLVVPDTEAVPRVESEVEAERLEAMRDGRRR